MLKFMKKLERIQIESRKKEFKLKLHTLIREKLSLIQERKIKMVKLYCIKLIEDLLYKKEKKELQRKLKKLLKERSEKTHALNLTRLMLFVDTYSLCCLF